MGLDDDDTPKGEIVALVIVASIVVLILVITFDSCADFEMGDMYNFCEAVVIELHPVLGESSFCFNTDGEVEFSVLNRGSLHILGVNLRYNDFEVNVTSDIRPISQESFKVDLGLRIGQEFRHINITPIVFHENNEEDVLCERSVQRINRLLRCGVS